MPKERIAVRSHVGRDLLQSAALFKTDILVVWEYVSNGLQYIDSGVSPVVYVHLDSQAKQITVIDNGRGMDRTGLKNFFLMHGENLDRKAGHRGRGRFGTGKAAAFGIADRLRVRSVRNGRRNVVELCKRDVEAAGDGNIAVRTVEEEIDTREPNGTIIEISGIRLRTLDQAGIIRAVERHLAHWPNKPLVQIDNHVCEPPNPPLASQEVIRPTGAAAKTLGNVELHLKIAKIPLEPEMQGVSIFADGVWLETSLVGAEGQPMSQYIFGEIDVPRLDDDNAPIAAYDMSRSMKLNPHNEVVRALHSFLGPEIDRVRRELVKEEQSRRSMREAKELAREASKIAGMINDDFKEFSDRVARVRARAGTGRDSGPQPAATDQEPDVLVAGDLTPASINSHAGAFGQGGGAGGDGDKLPVGAPVLTPDAEGKHRGQPAGGRGARRGLSGGFSVEFRNSGLKEKRALYDSDRRTIFVNLEHPQIAAAKAGVSTDDLQFRRLAYEVAFAEYAIALGRERDNQGDYLDASEVLFDIRETLNRMACRAAALYAR